ncbi:hypothetical protein [Umezawaea sp. Da 62-37]|uniref:hypothetical protein n=1 Tax=Umezawaea sp. Da 62-37 TaxID=3075927 RepID=UPI0028F728A6|nr:hypothetical protein [Umezawaea sp. Da 62-37]WNV85107.1 hypothetical protein RM788_44360 [Umezawaea sp. Da 62-37]
MTASAARAVSAARNSTVVLGAAVVGATALVLLDAPAVLRSVVALPVLVLVAGVSATGLLFGRGAPAGDTSDVDPVLRLVLPVLFGLLSPLAVVLVLAVIGAPIGTAGVAVGTGTTALLLLGADRWSAPHAEDAPRVRARAAVRRAAGPVLAAAVLAAAVAGAAAMLPTRVESYAQFAFEEPGLVAGRPVVVQPGARVVLRWSLRGYGSALPAAEPPITVTVGGTPAADVDAVVGTREPGTAQGVVDARHGTVAFTAPPSGGLHDVVVVVGDGPAASELTMRLAVGQ